MNDDLTQALAELRRVTPPNSPWEAGDIGVGSSPVDYHIATILNAALSGDLIPRADADLAVALMVALMVEKTAGICKSCADADIAYADKYPDEAREYEGRAHRATTLSEAIFPLAPASALAELQALRDERDYLREELGITEGMLVSERTELATFRAQIEALTPPPDFEEGAAIGFALGVDDCRKKVAAAETRAWNAAIEAACKVALEWAKAPFVGDLTLPDEYIRALKKGE